MGCYIHFQKSIRAIKSEAFGLLECLAKLRKEGVRAWQGQRFGEIPEEFMEVSHQRKHLKHLPRGLWNLLPALSGESDLRNLLSGSETVIYGAAAKARLPEACMNAAAKVCL